jgi:spiro-SPASM protein
MILCDTMRNIAILNGYGLSPYAIKPLAGGASALSRAIATARALPAIDGIILAAGPASDEGALAAARREGLAVEKSAATGLEAFIAELGRLAQGYDNLFLIQADAALMDAKLSAEVASLHEETHSEFTFADGYPRGFSPELLRVSAIPALVTSAAKAKEPGIPPEPVFAAIQKDINAFDVETVISPIDMRAHRLNLCATATRDPFFLDRILMDAGFPADNGAVPEFLSRRRDLHRSLPAYYCVQIAEACPQACSYCPYPTSFPGLLGATGFMPLERFRSVVSQAKQLSGDAVIGLSPWGESALHPDVVGIFEAALREEGISLLVETSGLGWKDGALREIAALPGSGRIDWVVSLDAASEADYRALRGEGFARALIFME